MQSKNIKLLLLIKLIGGLLFFLPVGVLYLEESLFSLANVGFILALESVCFSLFEIPTGALSDVYGRKRVLVFAHIISFLAIIFLLQGGPLWVFSFYAILTAFSRSLVSGTDEALVYDTLLSENREKEFPETIGKLFAFWPVGASIASLVGSYIATYSLKLTVAWSLLPQLIALILCLFLEEPKVHKPVEKKLTLHISSSLKEVFASKLILLILLLSAILWGVGEPLHKFTSLFFVERQISIGAIGSLFTLAYGLSAFGHYVSGWFIKKYNLRNLLLVCLFLTPFIDFFSTVTFGYLAGVLAMVTSFTFAIRNTIISKETNALVTSNNRATILSISSAFKQFLITVGTLLAGYFADIITITQVFQIFLVIELTIPILIALIYFKQKAKVPN